MSGATKFRFITVLCLVIEKTSFGNPDNSPGYEEPILVYCGNGRQAYETEVKSLYPDMALAQEIGDQSENLRNGEGFIWLTENDHALRRRDSIELGSAESSRISHLLELEDLLI